MLIINGKKTSLLELEKGKISEKNHSVFENEAIELIKNWNKGLSQFHFETSGSTGKRKEISIRREILQYSANATLKELGLEKENLTSLIAINIRFIGGTMAIIRALVGQHNLEIISPSANPIGKTVFNQFDLVSMVPIQIQTICDENINLFNNISNVIIGGAPLSNKYLELLKKTKHTAFYHSYGMTETASHFALKNIRTDEYFKVIGDAKMNQNEDGCLEVCGTVTDGKWVKTTDLVQIIDKNHFKWLGRIDNIINSGGVKVSPEEIERVLEKQISKPFFIAGIHDDRLGQKVVLVVESDTNINIESVDFANINYYAIPKTTIKLQHFIYTETGKINRPKTLKLIQN